MSDPKDPKDPRPRRWLPRFTLRTLLFLVLLCASAFGLWWRWEPEYRAYPLPQSTEAPVCEYWLSPNGQFVCAGAVDGSVMIWRMSNYEKISEVKGHLDRTSDICFSPDSKFVATCCWKDSGKLWDNETGKELIVLKNHDGQNVTASFGVDFSKDSRFLVVGNWGGMEVWDLRTYQWMFSIPERWERYLCFFSDDGKFFQTASGCYEMLSGKIVERPKADSSGFNAKHVRSPSDGSFYVGRMKGSYALCVYKKRQSYWWLTKLPEFWLTILFGFGLLWSLVRDFRTLRAKSVQRPAGAPG